MSAVGWGLLGDRLGDSVIESLCDGPVSRNGKSFTDKKDTVQVKISVEILFLLHLISAFPILMNPPSQFFEGLLKIPSSGFYI